MSTGGFRDLEVWKKARAIAIQVYGVTSDGPLAKDFALRDQMRRSAISVCSNIAEGNERHSDKDTLRFLYIAKGSAAELITQADIANAIGYLQKDASSRLIEDCEEVARMLGGLIKYRENSSA